MAAPQHERRSDSVRITDASAERGMSVLSASLTQFTALLKLSKTKVSPSNTTGFTVLPAMPPRSNVHRNAATRRTTIWRQRERDTSSSLHSLDFLTRRFLDFAPPTVVALQHERRSGLAERGDRAIGVLAVLSTSPTAAVFYIAENFPTGLAVLPIMPPRSNVSRYQTQLPKQIAPRRTPIQAASKGYSVLSPYNKRFKLRPYHADLYVPLISRQLSDQPTLTGEVLTNPKVQIIMGSQTSCKAA
ncbi:uncharacterized protein ARMOST_13628 [Armillaria ostoyae]|uniref:Uncharacterized protein n=1 Tax=Armillaria ostoyae TaxID=47428 RepID=A0A284RNE7_ARMOS|nr:uncharacterized protein ARMOST_13628 [Armillaria ostoyae]